MVEKALLALTYLDWLTPVRAVVTTWLRGGAEVIEIPWDNGWPFHAGDVHQILAANGIQSWGYVHTLHALQVAVPGGWSEHVRDVLLEYGIWSE